jgi:AraC-like DNA-binding protein
LVLETKPNTIRFLPEGNASRYDVIRHKRGECIFVCFKADRPLSPVAFVTEVTNNEKIGMLFKKMFSTWVSKCDGYYFETISILYKIFAEFQNSHYIPKNHYDKIKPAVDYIYENFSKGEITVFRLSELCGIGEAYFQRLFKNKYGISPKKFIIQLKINHASELLTLGRYSITEIAELCNFSNVYFFSRQFKEYMGITPTEFSEKYKSSK